jgi:predicted RNA-binding Zn ribbon-like protein
METVLTPKLTAVRKPRFELCAGHPALELVNSLDHRFRQEGPVERLADYTDLLRFAEQTRLLAPRQARRLAGSVRAEEAARALRSARELREALASACYAVVDGRRPADADLRTLERHFHGASRHRELRWEKATGGGGEPVRLKWHWGRYETCAELPVWMLSLAARELVISGSMDRVRPCAAQSCRWLFLDTSKSHARRWCDMKVCGNRMKARRFQARRRRDRARSP